MFRHNRHQVPLAAAMAEDMGVDEFRAQPGWDVSWDEPGIETTDAESVRYAFDDVFAAVAGNWNPFPNELAAAAIDRAFDESWNTVEEPGSQRSAGPSPEPACEWLYKNLTMDAGGRILPCCCSPRRDGELVFAQFDGIQDSDTFNSEKFQAARQLFAGQPEPAVSQGVFCAQCEFDKSSDPSTEQLRNYFWAASIFAKRGCLGERSLNELCSWRN